MTAPLVEGAQPPGYWARRTEWRVSSVDDAVAARSQARSIVAGRDQHPASDPTGSTTTGTGRRPVFAAASARVEMALGELMVNGLKHGGAPVTATLARGHDGWMLEVADTAADAVPTLGGSGSPDDPGGLGLRLTSAMAEGVGWYVEGGRKYVWALISDEPPTQLMVTLGA